jgi:hypothetical protein
MLDEGSGRPSTGGPEARLTLAEDFTEMNRKELQNDDETLLFPVEFLNNLEKPPAVVQFLDKNNQYVRGEIVDDVFYDVHSGRYQVKDDSTYKFQITTSKDGKLTFIVAVILSQMKNELQFGNVLTSPAIAENFERMVLATIRHNDSHLFINELSSYSNDLVKRSIHSCGLGIALGLFLEYEDESVKAIGLGGLLHEYGYLIDPAEHTVSGVKNLGTTFFRHHDKYTNIVMDIIEHHHAVRPHKSPQVNCGKIAIHWCSQKSQDLSARMMGIHSRRSLYSNEIYNGFRRLYDLMTKRKVH